MEKETTNQASGGRKSGNAMSQQKNTTKRPKKESLARPKKKRKKKKKGRFLDSPSRLASPKTFLLLPVLPAAAGGGKAKAKSKTQQQTQNQAWLGGDPRLENTSWKSTLAREGLHRCIGLSMQHQAETWPSKSFTRPSSSMTKVRLHCHDALL